MNEFAIETSALAKDYGKVIGVSDLDLVVRRGEVFGYLGPNGAGKTTTIRLLLDLIHPTSGTARVLGLDSHADSLAIRSRIGYVPGELAMYEDLTGRELCRYFSSLRGTGAAGVDSLAERLDLDLDRPIKEYSSGNRQKVGLVQAFMHEPELLILDEPTTGLDPLVQQEFYRLIAEVKSRGATVFLSSHILPEVEHVADRVGIIRNGRLVVVEEVASLKARALRRIEIHFEDPVVPGSLDVVPGVREATYNGSVVNVVIEGSMDSLIKALAANTVTNIVSHEADLEEVFLEMYRGEDTHA